MVTFLPFFPFSPTRRHAAAEAPAGVPPRGGGVAGGGEVAQQWRGELWELRRELAAEVGFSWSLVWEHSGLCLAGWGTFNLVFGGQNFTTTWPCLESLTSLLNESSGIPTVEERQKQVRRTPSVLPCFTRSTGLVFVRSTQARARGARLYPRRCLVPPPGGKPFVHANRQRHW